MGKIEVVYELSSLFDQLGLPSDPHAIDEFVHTYTIPNHVKLYDASIWSHTQATFLREGLLEDSQWALVIDQLNVLLKLPRP